MRWAKMMRWDVPSLHVDLCVWLEEHQRDPLSLVMIFRGASKSTIVSEFKAWQLRAEPTALHQVWGADKTVATKMSRYTRYVLSKHPWCAGLFVPRGPIDSFCVVGAIDA